jgi:hypothetical protein
MAANNFQSLPGEVIPIDGKSDMRRALQARVKQGLVFLSVGPAQH